MSDKFDCYMKKLLELCDNIDKARLQGPAFLFNKPREEAYSKALQKYRKVYQKTEACDHVDDVIAFYDRYKIYLLKGPQNDDWLQEKSVVLQFGANLQGKMKKKVEGTKLMLSIYYKNALSLRTNIEKSLQGLSKEELEKRPEIQYPRLLLLYIYIIISEVIPEEKEKEIIRAYADSLGASKDEAANNPPPAAPPLGGNFINNLLEQGMGLAKRNGLISPETPIPSGADIGSLIGNFLSRPELKNVFSSVSEKVKKSKNLKEMTENAIDALKEIVPPFIEAAGLNPMGEVNDENEEENEEADEGEEEKKE